MHRESRVPTSCTDAKIQDSTTIACGESQIVLLHVYGKVNNRSLFGCQVAGSDLDQSLFKDIQKGVFLVMVYELLFSGHKSIHGGVSLVCVIAFNCK